MYRDRFIAFDVETPNSRNDRMSAIGITVIENGASPRILPDYEEELKAMYL